MLIEESVHVSLLCLSCRGYGVSTRVLQNADSSSLILFLASSEEPLAERCILTQSSDETVRETAAVYFGTSAWWYRSPWSVDHATPLGHQGPGSGTRTRFSDYRTTLDAAVSMAPNSVKLSRL